MACRFSSLYRKHVLSPHSFARCADNDVWRVASVPYTASIYYHLTLLLDVRILVYGVSLPLLIPQACIITSLLQDVQILMYGVSLPLLIPQVCIITSLFC